MAPRPGLADSEYDSRLGFLLMENAACCLQRTIYTEGVSSEPCVSGETLSRSERARERSTAAAPGERAAFSQRRRSAHLGSSRARLLSSLHPGSWRSHAAPEGQRPASPCRIADRFPGTLLPCLPSERRNAQPSPLASALPVLAFSVAFARELADGFYF